ncbi:MAG: sugar ABC transporter permease, partial [Pseudomonadota bacterium]
MRKPPGGAPADLTAPAQPPKGSGPRAKREARLAWLMLAPTFLIVAFIVALPLAANFWISAKPVELADLRPPQATINERVSSTALAPGDTVRVTYTLRNSSPNLPVRDAAFTDRIPAGVTLAVTDPRCALDGDLLTCRFGELEPRARERLRFEATASIEIADAEELLEGTAAEATGRGENPLTNFDFTAENFARVFDATEFWAVLWTSILYTIFGTAGALVLGLFAALLLDQPFRGRTVLRGLFLFPYVAPVIAVAYTWVALLDPNSGALNAILALTGASESPVNFLGQRSAGSFSVLGQTVEIPLALTTVIVFEAWRYFPLSFLFILARMQSINTDMYEAAEIDGATPFQQFWYLSLPQLATILAILFLLRFIWTFNKFDD